MQVKRIQFGRRDPTSVETTLCYVEQRLAAALAMPEVDKRLISYLESEKRRLLVSLNQRGRPKAPPYVSKRRNKKDQGGAAGGTHPTAGCKGPSALAAICNFIVGSVRR
jgi:hypothetical protein